MKDFVNSYEQLRWKHAADQHARLSLLKEKYEHNPAFASFMDRLNKLEEEYPCLKIKD